MGVGVRGRREQWRKGIGQERGGEVQKRKKGKRMKEVFQLEQGARKDEGKKREKDGKWQDRIKRVMD